MYNRQLQEKIAQELAREQCIVLSTFGPAGLQVGRFDCEAHGLSLFLLVPATADLRLNLDPEAFSPSDECPAVIATGETWQAHCLAQVLTWGRSPSGLQLAHRPDSRWAALVELRIRRFDKFQPNGWGFSESFDLDDVSYG